MTIVQGEFHYSELVPISNKIQDVHYGIFEFTFNNSCQRTPSIPKRGSPPSTHTHSR